MLNLKEVSGEFGPTYIAHIENGVVYPLVGLDAIPGCSFHFAKSALYPIQDGDSIEDYTEEVSELQSLWLYIHEHQPGAVSNKHLLFGEGVIV